MPQCEPKTGTKRRGKSNKGRTLVRWDNDKDILLLLTIQQVCNYEGIKVPWYLVAETMGVKFTEGAIIQHLSKVRLRRMQAGKQVPPPLRRSVPSQGSKGTSASSMTAGQGKGKKRQREVTPNDTPDEDADYESDDPPYTTKPNRAKRAKAKARVSLTNGRGQKGKKITPREISPEAEEEESRVCIGADFLKLSGEDAQTDAGSDNGLSSSETDGRESEFEDEGSEDEYMMDETPQRPSKVVTLPVRQAALQNLQETGTAIPSEAISGVNELSGPNGTYYNDQNLYPQSQTVPTSQFIESPYLYQPAHSMSNYNTGMPQMFNTNASYGFPDLSSDLFPLVFGPNSMISQPQIELNFGDFESYAGMDPSDGPLGNQVGDYLALRENELN
ncbi:hypothetical protein N7466_000750 [Penicillium verhagenii]|uniref:uncharacterized protein n=1 Tax=Penicillium verhagenii TaxID=1562060 RepID=UPI002545BA60|nr:uncharacterized protein N7466_000750 [Penicillium verhagenii]KAJ5947735.1 hypothetical protein N7466_000750 [Penicillium verhagenii]